MAKQHARTRRRRKDDDWLASSEVGAAGAPGRARSPAFSANSEPLLEPGNVADLQQTAGNRATVTAIQRRAVTVQRDGSGPGNTPATSKNRPTHGADVRSVLRSELPGLLAGLTEAQLNHWQQVVDCYAIDRHIQREIAALTAEWSYRAGPLFESSGQYQLERRRLDDARPPMPEGGMKLTVDPSLLLADDVVAEPEWDVKAEMAFRQWAVGELTKSPPVFDIYPEHDDEIVGRRTSVGSYTTKGLITLADLRHQFRAQYQAQVVDRDDWKMLRQALADTRRSFDEATELHRERSDRNRDNRGVFGVDIVRNLIEAVGHGDQEYPAMAQWDEPRALITRAESLLGQGQFELLVPVLAMAELSTAQAADRIFAYDERVESGAKFWVKWLGRVKTVGSVAAGIAAGPLGVTGSALVAGGYTFVQEGGQNAMAYALGQRADLGLKSLVTQAGITTVTAMLGGALQTRFKAAMDSAIAEATQTAGGALRDLTTSAAAAMTASTYNTAAELVLNKIIAGQAFPRSANELADLVLDHALQAGAMDLALRAPSARAAREYAVWKAGSSAPAASAGPGPTPPAASTSPPNRAAASVAPAAMPEGVVRRMLAESASWSRLQGELQAGTGLGHGLAPAERQALLDRFNATREQLASDVAGMFAGTVVIADTGAGRQVEVRFPGDQGAEHSTQATHYLDTKSPGWQRQTEVALRSGGPELGARGTRAMRALEVATPEARLLAARFAPLYEGWAGVGPIDKVRALVQVVNDYNRQFGVPDIYPMIGRSENAGQFHWKGWQLEIHPRLVAKRNQTPEEFARLVQVVVHEGQHARDAFRAIRVNPQRAKGRVADEAYEAALAADSNTRPAESMDPNSLAYAEGLQFSESVWGSGRQHRKEVYEHIDAASEALERAIKEVGRNRGQPRNSDARNDAARFYWTAKASQQRAHDDYMRLPEEVGPWRVGKEVQAAMRERLALEQEMRTVRDQVEATFDRVRRTEDAYVDAALNTTTGLAAAERAFERAQDLYRRTVAQLERLRARHAGLTQPAAP